MLQNHTHGPMIPSVSSDSVFRGQCGRYRGILPLFRAESSVDANAIMSVVMRVVSHAVQDNSSTQRTKVSQSYFEVYRMSID